jgi:eukaryotic-like serine/threonine-protein kinase
MEETKTTITKIGKYDVIDVLGEGGMGIVYRAVDNRIGRLVAIKMMTGGYADNPDLLKRFYREAQSAGSLQHPNIVIIYDLGEEGGNPYMVMEYMPGEPLDKIIDVRRPMSIVDRLGIIIQVCSALNYAHQHGIVHRDIKPGNVMVMPDGSVKILDFGIARVQDKSMTKTGQIIGTINYMSPEQLKGQVVDGRSDIFSAGVVLYELLSGSLPFETGDTASTIHKILHEPPPPLKNYLAEYPQELDAAIERALAKDRDERYATAEDFGFELLAIQETQKRQMVSEYVAQARSYIKGNDYTHAKELLQQVLKIDTHHTDAKLLMAEVQKAIATQQRGEQLKELRAHAEESLKHQQYTEALSLLDQALKFDKTNSELQNMREVAHKGHKEREQLDIYLRQAESARQEGRYEVAQQAVQKALAVSPNNTHAKGVLAAIVKEAEQQATVKKIRDLLDVARRAITSRNYGEAIEVLRKAEQLDPAMPEVHALMNLVTSTRDQESRRKELEAYTREIESALAHDDFRTANANADEALKKFPGEPTLLKLKATAEKQLEAGENKRFIEEQAVQARKMMDTGRATEALDLLERANQKVRGDTRLRSLISIVRDSVDKEKAQQIKANYVQKSKAAIERKNFDEAVALLEQAQAELSDSPEIHELLEFARAEAMAQRKAHAFDEAHKAIADDDYQAAIAVLEKATKEFPNDDDLKLLLAETQGKREQFQRKVEAAISGAKRMLDAKKYQEAMSFLESQPRGYCHSEAFAKLLQSTREQYTKVKAVTEATQQATAAMKREEYLLAWNVLQACYRAHGDSPEIRKALLELESKRSIIAKTAVEKVIRDARQLMLAKDYSKALRTLQGAADLVSAAPAELKTEWEAAKDEAAAGATRSDSGEANRTIVQGSIVPGMPVASRAAAGAAPARRTPAPAPAPEPKRGPMIAAIIGALVLVAAVAGYLIIRNGAAAKPDTSITINAVPWATVKSVTNAKGKIVAQDQETPIVIPVPSGDYTVVLEGPDHKTQTENVTAGKGSPARVNSRFETPDVEEIIRNAR